MPAFLDMASCAYLHEVWGGDLWWLTHADACWHYQWFGTVLCDPCGIIISEVEAIEPPRCGSLNGRCNPKPTIPVPDLFLAVRGRPFCKIARRAILLAIKKPHCTACRMFAPLVSPVFFCVQATSVDGVSPFQNRWAHRVYPWYPRRALPLYSRACHTQSFAFYACDSAFFSIQWRQYSQFKRFGEHWLLWCVWRCLLLLFFEPLGSSMPVSGVAMGWGWSRGWGWVFGFVLFSFLCSAGAQIVLNVPIFLNGSKTSLCDMAWLYLGCSCSWFVGTPAEVRHWMMLVRTSYFMVDLGIGSYWVYQTK